MNRTIRTNLMLAMVLAVLLCAVGCQSAEQRLAIANDTFATTLDALSDQRQAHKIDDRTQTEVIAPARRAVDSLLDKAYDAAANGESLTLNQILGEIDKEMTPLLRQRFSVKREVK